MSEVARVAVLTGLWVAAVGLMIVWTVIDTSPLVLAGWALLAGMAACVVTGWHLMVHERCRIEHVARLAAEAAVEHTGLKSIV